MFLSPQLLFRVNSKTLSMIMFRHFFDPDLVMRFTGELCMAQSAHTCPKSYADIRLHLQGTLYKTISCHKDYENYYYDFSRYTFLTSIERKYQKEIISMLHVQMLL